MHDDGDEFGDVYDNRRIFYSVHTEAQWTQQEDETVLCPGESNISLMISNISLMVSNLSS